METLQDTNAGRRLRVLSQRPVGTLRVHEVFASIQGESTYAGLPCSFVRLTGCPLRCRWCDTPYAFYQGTLRTIAEIVTEVSRLAPGIVELTGGEPLAHDEAPTLLTALADLGKKVLLETSGAYSIAEIDERVCIILDVKCPGSGEATRNRLDNLVYLKPDDELKFVISDRNDFDWAIEFIRRHELTGRILHFSPVFGEQAYRPLCDWIVASGLPVRFQPQLHKHIWDPNQRGV